MYTVTGIINSTCSVYLKSFLQSDLFCFAFPSFLEGFNLASARINKTLAFAFTTAKYC